MSLPVDDAVPSPDLKGRVLEAARAQPAPTRAQWMRVKLVATFASLVTTALLFFLAGGPHAQARPRSLVGVSAAIWTLAAVLLTLLALGRGRSMLGFSPRTRWIAIVLAPFALALAWAIAVKVSGGTTVGIESAGATLACLALSVLFALPALIVPLLLLRGAEPVAPGALGAAIGAAAAGWGAVLIDLHCENALFGHVVVGHVLPVVVLAVVGGALGLSLLGVRDDAAPVSRRAP